MKHSKSFSLLEILFCLIILGIFGVGALYSITNLKRQDVSIQKFLLKNSSLYETELFINKMLSYAKADSIKIGNNTLSWQGYDKLFLSAKNNDKFMDFSLQTSSFNISLQHNNLYFNNTLLLHNVKVFDINIKDFNTDRILEYTLCTHICIQDFIFLENIEIEFDKL
ncbi:type II secretion system protein [Helicobacter saguini]|uniref:Type II secretion system protein n=1 Tax=Helicobacter saguini TaxID=1548018 RepID=A0A347VRA6_9HELI|nr:prepilin-type N-terminal cleavage/methylation domain-containing protein [Helicobacter saguini]MWV62975.1 type II secretion system protein [Helicobacter saguini]MWV66356.1 type II secretion system protein [Helicobacter saguini]MWV68708.1 type II secretion system protein [Helicobacter saguini]MWV71741.1 type II secretion system protein [Helicobacter saguini]TLD92180.1 type II secretion system protein [Helicobacter saguini]